MSTITTRVGLQQRVFPEYRAPFFDLLSKACLQGFSFFYGHPRSDEAIIKSPNKQTFDVEQGLNVHLFRGRTYFCYQRGLIKWLERWQPNVLVVEANPRYLSTPAAIQWMHSRGRKVVGWGLGAPPAGKAESILRNSFLKSLDAVIAYSKTGAEQYISCGLDASKVFVAPNAAARRPSKPIPDRPETFDKGIANLLFVGRLQARKRIEILIQACASLPEKTKPDLVIVGDGPERERLETLARDVYPNTRFVGAKHGVELEPFFNQADLFVLPGTGGLAVQQAMAHALPVIVGEADGTQGELVRPQNGWILPSADVETMATTLHIAFSDRKKLRTMGEASYQIVMEEVNLEIMVDQFVKALKSVL